MAGLAILCSGQGKQDVAMFEWLRSYPEALALETKIRATGILPAECNNPELWFRNDLAQPLICLYQAMVWEVLKPSLPQPDIFAGYSVGELSAYGCAGVFAPEELIQLAVIRGRLMNDAAVTPQTMAAIIGLNVTRIKQLADSFEAYIAIINAADHFVLGVPVARLEALLAAATAAGAVRSIHLPVTVASHTPFMDQAAEAFGKTLQNQPFQQLSGNIPAGINGEKVFTGEQMINALTAQIHQTIDWHACLETAFASGCRIFLELGPGSSLSRMVLDAFPGTESRSASEFHDLYAVKKWFDAASSRQ